MTRPRALDGTYARRPGPPTHSHFGEHNKPDRPGADCLDCRDTEPLDDMDTPEPEPPDTGALTDAERRALRIAHPDASPAEIAYIAAELAAQDRTP